jgi:two-component system, NtrC family, sensor kinase
MNRVLFGLRAQLIVALLVVLAIAATLAMVAIQPLTYATGRIARRRLGLTLARSVAGEVALTHDPDAVQSLLHNSVGDVGLRAAALYDLDRTRVAYAGALVLRSSIRPSRLMDDSREVGDVLGVLVLLPGRGVFVAETSLAPSAAERAIPVLILLYTVSAGVLALVVVYLLLTRWIVRPMESLTLAAERVAAGRRDVRAEPGGAAEVHRAADAFNRMTEQLVARESEASQRVRELERTTRELKRAQEQVVRGERLATVGRLSAGLAHEVGNPLAAIVGLSEVMADGGLDDAEVKEFSGRIASEAQRIHRTIRELLDYARASPSPAGVTQPGAHVTGDLRESAEQVARLLGPQKNMRDVKFVTQIADDVRPVNVSTDRLVQVILNLVLNAADAIHGAGVTQGTIVLRARTERDRVMIEVEDNGPGIAEEVRARVFEPFFTTKPAGEGTGLGLATSAAIVEQAGGTITVQDPTSGASGARFVIELPMAGRRTLREPTLPPL